MVLPPMAANSSPPRGTAGRSQESVHDLPEFGRLKRSRSGRLTGRLVSDSVWQVASVAFIVASMLISIRLLTEAMPREDFGAVNLLIGIVTLSRNVFCQPFLMATSRYYPECALRGEKGMLRRVVFRDLGRSTLILAGLIVLGGVPCFQWHLKSLLLVPLLVGLIIAENLCALEIALLLAAQRQRATAVMRGCEACLRPFAAILLIRWLRPTPAVIILGFLIAEFAVYAGLFIFRVDRVGADDRPGSSRTVTPESRELRRRIWRFGLPLVPIPILEWLSNVGDRYMIGGLIGLKPAGAYIAAYSLVSHPFYIAQGLPALLLCPIYFDAVARGDDPRARRILLNWLAITIVLCVLGIAAFTLLGDTIARILLAQPYRSASRLFPWIAVGNALLALCLVLERPFQAWHRTGNCLLVRCAGSILSVAVGVPMILLWGIDGAARAVPIYFGAQLALTMALYRFAKKELNDTTRDL